MIAFLFRRLWRQRGLSLTLAAGMLLVVAFSAAIPLYADAVQYRLLTAQLQKEKARPPFAFLFRYVGDWYGPVSWKRYRAADAYLDGQVPSVLRLPHTMSVRYVRTGKLQLFPVDESGYRTGKPLFWTNLAFISSLHDHVRLVDGDFPGDAAGAAHAIPVLVSRSQAEKTGLQVGERYVLRSVDGVQLTVRISGVWVPLDEDDRYWFYAPDTFRQTLLTGEPVFAKRVAPRLTKPVDQAVWYHIFDGKNVRSGQVDGLLRRIAGVQSRANALLPHVSLDASPAEALMNYRQQERHLAMQVTLFSLPIFAVLLAFLGLMGDLLGQRRRNEIAVLRSRGVSRWQVTLLQLGESALLGALTLPAGLLLAGIMARRLGAVRVFLDPAFVLASAPLPVRYGSAALLFALAALAVAVVAAALPAWSSSRHTIVSYKQEQSRQLRLPFWQRYYLDLLLLLPALYGYYVLRGRDFLRTEADFFRNPLLFLVPTLFVLATTLLAVRIFSFLMQGAAAIGEHFTGISLLMALRNLARAPATIASPLVLLVLTLGLSTFTASTALTLDRHLYDRIYYRVGADMHLTELGENVSPQSQATPGASSGKSTGAAWLFLPVSEHLRIPGVLAAARVGDFTALAMSGGPQENGRMLGVDRVDFQKVAFFRPDFAQGQSLGALMNRLAEDPMAVLVQRRFLEQHGLHVGDPLALTVQKGDRHGHGVFVIAGVFDLFPTTYPSQGPIFVASLDTLFEALGGELPYDVWLRLAPGTDGKAVVAGVRELGIQVVDAEDARSLIREAQTSPARQGIFGILSAGFLSAAFLTMLSFVIVAFLSFQRRYVELGVLRALGLSRGQMALLLGAEQAILLVTGVIAGTGLGVLTSYVFIPLLQPGFPTPPFVVRIAWNAVGGIVLFFAVALSLSVASLLSLLARLKLFRAVKLGEMV